MKLGASVAAWLHSLHAVPRRSADVGGMAELDEAAPAWLPGGQPEGDRAVGTDTGSGGVSSLGQLLGAMRPSVLKTWP